MNIAGNLTRSAAAHPDRDAIRLDGMALSYPLPDGATPLPNGPAGKILKREITVEPGR